MGTQKNRLNETVLLSTQTNVSMMDKKLFTISRSNFLLIWTYGPTYLVAILKMNVNMAFFTLNTIDDLISKLGLSFTIPQNFMNIQHKLYCYKLDGRFPKYKMVNL